MPQTSLSIEDAINIATHTQGLMKMSTASKLGFGHQDTAISPYAEAWHWVERHPGTGSANSLAKLLLSLWNQENAFSFRECVHNLDAQRIRLALRVVIHFAECGEDSELIKIGYKVYEAYPRLWELGEAATRAKFDLQEKWGASDAREDA
jgi:hypothetical protein